MTITNRKIQFTSQMNIGELKSIGCDEFNNIYLIFGKKPNVLEFGMIIPNIFDKKKNKKNKEVKPTMFSEEEDIVVKLNRNQGERLIKFIMDKFK